MKGFYNSTISCFITLSVDKESGRWTGFAQFDTEDDFREAVKGRKQDEKIRIIGIESENVTYVGWAFAYKWDKPKKQIFFDGLGALTK
jgi:hypothetical protein